MTAICNEIPLYGARLSAPPAKALSLLIKEQQRWKSQPKAPGQKEEKQEEEGNTGQREMVEEAKRKKRYMAKDYRWDKKKLKGQVSSQVRIAAE